MACPPNLDFLQVAVNSAKDSPFKNLRDFVLPSKAVLALPGNPVVDFSVYVHCTRKCTTQVDEVLDCLEVIPSPLCVAPGMSFLVQPGT